MNDIRVLILSELRSVQMVARFKAPPLDERNLMSVNENVSAETMSMAHAELRQATEVALGQQVPRPDLDANLSALTSAQAAPAIGATASVKLAIWGKIEVETDGQPWKYDETIWGGPAYVGSGVGFMYTAYETWDAFFRNVSSFHAQRVDAGGGVFQVNWFISNGTPVGQFNGVAGGVGVFEAGGAGTWKHT